MASVSRPRGTSELRSGGKIVRPRPTAAPSSPYERPPHLLPISGPQNPNWLSRLILSPTRMIATGAGKVLSVFRSDCSSCSSSSDGDFTSECDSDNTNNDTGVSSQDAKDLEKIDSLGKDPQAIDWKSETKRAIERLLLQETFSREECDRLTHIIKSRVVDPPLIGGIDGRLSEICNRTVGNDVDIPDLCSAALTEAKKWLEENKLGSNSKTQLEYGTCTLNTTVSPHVIEGETGSPVDLAKSYMRERPSWASPSMSNIQLKSPSPIRMQLFKEDIPYLYGGNSLSTSKVMKDSSSIGSWNILEEIRKVRSKATEDMLRMQQSSIVDWSALASDDKRSPGTLVADKDISASQIAQDGLLDEASPPDPDASIPQQSQDLVATQFSEGAEGLQDNSVERLNHGQRLQPSENMKAESQSGDTAAAADGPKDADEAGGPLNSTLEGDTQDYRSHEMNCSTLVEVAIKDGAVAANGFPSSGSSLYAVREGEQNHKPFNEQEKLVDSAHDNSKKNVPIDETCESESDMEVPIVNEFYRVGTGSQDSSSMQHEGLSQDPFPPTLKRKAGKRNVVSLTEKQQGAKRRYARKGKGRGK